MKRAAALLLVSALCIAAVAGPAAAAKKKKKKPPAPQPVPVTLYFEGDAQFGEEESFTAISDAFLKLSTAEPDGSQPKSKQITNYGAGPNTNCAGNTLFPVFVGPLTGTVTGQVKITVYTIASPLANVQLRIWPDVNSTLCNSTATGAMDYPDPAGEVQVALPPGQGSVEGVIENVSFQAEALLMLQVTPVTTPPFFGRVLYDTSSAASKIEFMCTPPAGASTCIP